MAFGCQANPKRIRSPSEALAIRGGHLVGSCFHLFQNDISFLLFLAWHRRLIARKCDYTDKRPGPGRPGVMRQNAVNNDGSGES
jgi:hypothetical protein